MIEIHKQSKTQDEKKSEQQTTGEYAREGRTHEESSNIKKLLRGGKYQFWGLNNVHFIFLCAFETYFMGYWLH